jgi:hypothetical protein
MKLNKKYSDNSLLWRIVLQTFWIVNGSFLNVYKTTRLVEKSRFKSLKFSISLKDHDKVLYPNE